MVHKLYLKKVVIKIQKRNGIRVIEKILGKKKDLNSSPTGCVVLSKLLNLSASQIHQLSSEYIISL